MIKRFKLLVAILFLSSSFAFTQQKDSCKVLMNEISGTYNGKCKNGLANGKGSAIGEDTYIGMFKDGLPDGKGKYTYSNGNIFNGYWSKGIKNGQGKFVYYIDGKKYIQTGYWKDGKFVGTTNPDEFYRVTNQSGIESYSIKKIEDNGTQIKISFNSSMAKQVPYDLKIKTSSGQLNQENKDFTIYNYWCPNNCTIHFKIKTAGGDRECDLSFEILKPGKYEVVITSN
jgi:hypothetical protein